MLHTTSPQVERHGVDMAAKARHPPVGTLFSLGSLSLPLECTKDQIEEMIQVRIIIVGTSGLNSV